MSEIKTGGGGLGFTSILTLIFVVCKLLHYIDWSWGWVFAPLLIGLAFSILILLFILAIAVFLAVSK